MDKVDFALVLFGIGVLFEIGAIVQYLLNPLAFFPLLVLIIGGAIILACATFVGFLAAFGLRAVLRAAKR